MALVSGAQSKPRSDVCRPVAEITQDLLYVIALIGVAWDSSTEATRFCTSCLDESLRIRLNEIV